MSYEYTNFILNENQFFLLYLHIIGEADDLFENCDVSKSKFKIIFFELLKCIYPKNNSLKMVL